MPAKDIFHDVVKKALVKLGWIITDDPLTLRAGGITFTQNSVQTNQLKLIVYDTKTEEITQWLT